MGATFYLSWGAADPARTYHFNGSFPPHKVGMRACRPGDGEVEQRETSLLAPQTPDQASIDAVLALGQPDRTQHAPIEEQWPLLSLNEKPGMK